MEHIYIKNLIANCEKALQTTPINKYVIRSVEELVALDEIGNAIYIIRDKSGDTEKTFEDFSKYKHKKLRACAKLNQPSPITYVGSSTTNLKSRLKQHLFQGPVKTYALHMAHWFKRPYEVEILEYDAPINILQLIEDSISYDLKPAFGKTGGNNK